MFFTWVFNENGFNKFMFLKTNVKKDQKKWDTISTSKMPAVLKIKLYLYQSY